MAKKIPHFSIPLDVPSDKRSLYEKNFQLITKQTGRLFLFAGDQRVEHLNNDFFGDDIAPDDASPEHLFKIASSARVGVFATQLGFIAKFAQKYPHIPYAVKLNSKSNLVTEDHHDPFSAAWYDVRQVVDFARQTKLHIPAVGYTVYVGSSYESAMLREAAQIVLEAHKAGLVVILWMYPRGKAVVDKFAAHTIAGAINVGSALGADFIKVNRPVPEDHDALQEIVLAAEGSRILFAGGDTMSAGQLLRSIHEEVNGVGVAGAAVGRNLHQRPLTEAVALANAIASVVYDGQTPEITNRTI
jgi:DhnA family fructose-bisphosphate aldolase class Ia